MSAGTAGRAPDRYHVLDSLRGICACMVAVYHLETGGLFRSTAFADHGFMFVDFFFVLSGFVIAASYGRRIAEGFSIRRFMLLRLGRIYPLHLLMLLVFLAFELAFLLLAPTAAGRRPFVGPFSPGLLGACLLLVQPFVGPDGTPWNGPSWSIAVEVWSYLLFAFGARWLGRWLVPVCLLLAGASCLYLGHVTNRYINVFHDGAMARCLFGFSLGVVAHRAHEAFGGHRPPGRWGTPIEVAAIVGVVAIVSAAGAGPLSLSAPPLFFLVVLLFAREAGAVSRVLRLRPFLFVGTLSYSIYMIHLFLIYRLTNALQAAQKLGHGRWALVETIDGHSHIVGGAAFGDALTIAMLAGVIACAWATYRFVERPAQRWSRRRVLGERPRHAAVIAEVEAPTF